MLSKATAFDGVRAAIILKRFKLGDKTVLKYTLRFDNCIVLTSRTNNGVCGDWEYTKVKLSTFDMDNDNSNYNCVIK